LVGDNGSAGRAKSAGEDESGSDSSIEFTTEEIREAGDGACQSRTDSNVNRDTDCNRGSNNHINSQRICCFADANHLANSK
jgi:hypothetical protein